MTSDAAYAKGLAARMTPIATWMGREIAAGHYRVRRVPRGPWVGVEVSLQDGMIYVVEDGARSRTACLLRPGRPDGRPDGRGQRLLAPDRSNPVWSERITEGEDRLLLARANWALVNSPSSPAANPNKPIDVNSIPISDLI